MPQPGTRQGTLGGRDGTFPSVCPLDCPDTSSLSVTADAGRVVRIDGSTHNPLTDGFVCAKVRRYPERVHSPLRVLYPQRRVGPKGEGRFERLSWDDAIAAITARFREIIATDGPEAILPYHYGGSSGVFGEGAIDAQFFNTLGACELRKTICAAPAGKVELCPPELGPIRFVAPPAAYSLTLISSASGRSINSILAEITMPTIALSMHRADAAARGIVDGDVLRVFNELGEVVLPVEVGDDVRPGVVSMPKGAWRSSTRNGATSTAVTPDHLTDIGDRACFNDARVEVEKAA